MSAKSECEPEAKGEVESVIERVYELAAEANMRRSEILIDTNQQTDANRD